MATVGANEIKAGNLIRYNGKIYRVSKVEFVKPGKGGAFAQIEMKDIVGGTKLNERFRTEEMLEKVVFESKPAQFLYKTGDELEFMDMESYEQMTLSANLLSGPAEFLIENMELMIDYADGEIVSVSLPQKVKVKIKETQPFLKGATKTSTFKPALLTNGLTVQIPDFIENDEEIIVSTDTLEYVERAK